MIKSNKLTSVLTELGLTEHEARVYFASLSLGPSTILKIAEVAEVKRTTVYSVVQALQQQGLVRIEVKGFKRLFVAENPEKLESILEGRREKFRVMLPEFAALYNLKGGESFIRYYEGRESIRAAYESLLVGVYSHDYYCSISEVGRWYAQDPEFFEDLRQRRAKKILDTRIIVNHTESSLAYKQKELIYNQKVKILPPDTELTSTISFTPSCIVFHQIIPPVVAIVVESKSVIQVHKEIFEIMWNALPE
ncbi:MAG: helix-turn-helix domain-containing protein [Candidatus Doudnabacteria bacterium]|nr:helix-turn-helix domain-containing protein [Candidatus Doudnabacteria bacterium]